MSKTDPVIHFDFPAKDPEGLSKFYADAFGWQTHALGAEAGNYVLAFTGETDPETRMPQKPGFINGGFYTKQDDSQQVKVTILVDDIKEAMKKVKEAGGTVLADEPSEMPGVGLFVDCKDPSGNVFTLNQDYTIKHL